MPERELSADEFFELGGELLSKIPTPGELERQEGQRRSLMLRELKAHRATLRAILEMDDINKVHAVCMKFLGGGHGPTKAQTSGDIGDSLQQ